MEAHPGRHSDHTRHVASGRGSAMRLARRALVRFGCGLSIVAAAGCVQHWLGLERAFAVFFLVGLAVSTRLWVSLVALWLRELVIVPANIFPLEIEALLPLRRHWLRALLAVPLVFLAFGALGGVTALGVGSGLLALSELTDLSQPPPPTRPSLPASSLSALRHLGSRISTPAGVPGSPTD